MDLALKLKNINELQLSPIKAMELEAAKRSNVVSLAQGIPSFQTPSVIRDFVIEKIEAGLCDKYSLTNGLPELREEIALSLRQDGLNYDSESEIIVTAGSIEAITASLIALTKPKDEIIIPSPTYTSYQNAIKVAGGIPRFAELDEERNFDLDINKIEECITSKTRAIFYCNPNNPTGTIFSKEASLDLLALAEEHDLLIITDEVYKDFYYTNHKHFTPASIEKARERVIRVCSFSKAFAMTGWRVAFVHTAAPLAKKILAVHDTLVTCAPVASQYAALAALRNSELLISDFKLEFHKRRDYMLAALDELSSVLDYQIPQASYFVFPRIKDTHPLSKDSTALAYDILDTVGLAVVPGVAFGPSGESHLRLSFGRDMSDIKDGMDRLIEYFSNSRAKVVAEPKKTRIKDSHVQTVKNFRRTLLTKLLGFSARRYLNRTKPLIIGIAGLRGKTIYKRIIEETLSEFMPTRAGILSYNTEIGFPLSILNLKVPKTLADYFEFTYSLLAKTFWQKPTSKVLILEYGIRSNKDAKHLSSITKPDWLVVTPTDIATPGTSKLEIEEGISSLIRLIAEERVICNCSRSDVCKEISPKDMESELVTDSHIEIGERKYPHSKSLPGESYKSATLAAVILAKNLGVDELALAKFLKTP